MKSLGEEMPSGGSFPKVLQVQKQVLGSLGCLSSVQSRSRYEADTVRNILESSVKGSGLIFKMTNTHKVPEGVLNQALRIKGTFHKSAFTQLVLTYLTDREICDFVNSLLANPEIQIEASGLYEEVEYPWIVTRYGLALLEGGKAIENLAKLIKDFFGEKDLLPELKAYSGDFETKVLEYCIMENPETILLGLFGLPRLRKIARKLGFVSSNIGGSSELVSLVLRGLGFNVPPSLAGISKYIADIERYKKELSESREESNKSAIMSQIFVSAERAIRDMACFYISFLWKSRLEDLESDLEEAELWGIESRTAKIKILDLFIRKKFGFDKGFERLGFGEFISLMKKVNNSVGKSETLNKRLSKRLDKDCILCEEEIKVLDSVSPFRACFTHAKDYPSDEKCGEIAEVILGLLKKFQSSEKFPLVIRISREVSDDYGKSYAECVDENADKWLLYTSEYLNTTYPYFLYSKTPKIAVNPVTVEKLF
jgi:hypothetical protein